MEVFCLWEIDIESKLLALKSICGAHACFVMVFYKILGRPCTTENVHNSSSYIRNIFFKLCLNFTALSNIWLEDWMMFPIKHTRMLKQKQSKSQLIWFSNILFIILFSMLPFKKGRELIKAFSTSKYYYFLVKKIKWERTVPHS